MQQGVDPQTGAEATLDQDQALGNATNFINLDGEKTGTTINLLNTLKTLKLKLKQANKAGDVATSPTDTWRVHMAPHLYFAIETELAALNNAAGVFTVEQVGGVERKRIWGIFDIIETNTLGKATTGGKDSYPIYISTPRATTYGNRLRTVQDLIPDNNPFGPYYKHDEYMQYYAEVIDPRFLYRVLVRAEA